MDAEQIQFIKDWYNDPTTTKKEKVLLEKLYPEVKESEDEKLRSVAEKILKGVAARVFAYEGVEKKDVLIWLDKRKEQKPLSPEDKVKHPLYVEGFEAGKEVGRQFEKVFGEQKPAEWSDSVAKEMFIKALERAVEQNKKGYELTDCDKHSWWEDFKAYSEINPAVWSERHIADVFEKVGLAKIVREQGNDALTDAVQSSMIELSKTKPAEWSEENLERAIKDWLYDNDCRGWDKYGNIYVSLRDLVKLVNHFGTQPHWKPSEEQMEWLKSAVKLSTDKPRIHGTIISLYEQLKRL